MIKTGLEVNTVFKFIHLSSVDHVMCFHNFLLIPPDTLISDGMIMVLQKRLTLSFHCLGPSKQVYCIEIDRL